MRKGGEGGWSCQSDDAKGRMIAMRHFKKYDTMHGRVLMSWRQHTLASFRISCVERMFFGGKEARSHPVQKTLA